MSLKPKEACEKDAKEPEAFGNLCRALFAVPLHDPKSHVWELFQVLQREASFPDFLDFELFVKTILVVKKQFELFGAHPPRKR